MRFGGGRMGERRSRGFVVCQRNAQHTRRVRSQKDHSILSYCKELRKIPQRRGIDCDCSHKYISSSQVRQLTEPIVWIQAVRGNGNLINTINAVPKNNR